MKINSENRNLHKEKAEEILRKVIIKKMGWNDVGDSIYDIKKQIHQFNIGWHKAKEIAYYIVDEIISACKYNNVETYNTDWWLKVKDEIRSI